METYRVTVKIKAETKQKAFRELYFRVPNGEICSVRKDNGNGRKPKELRNG